MKTGIYVRKSLMKDDKDAESLDVQMTRCEDRAKANGWIVVERYIDDNEGKGVSASKGLFRPEFQRMLDDIAKGKIEAILVREQSRISREEIEGFTFLKTIEQYKIHCQDSYGQDVKNDMVSKFRFMIDADYAKQISKLVTAKKQFNASQGKPPAAMHRPYGYERNYAAIIPEEAKVIRECADRFLAGETLYGIVKDLNKRGILKYTGKTWKTQDLSKILGRSENAAMRSYKGEVVNESGQWEAILDKDMYYQIRARLNENTAFSKTTVRKHLLTGILICDLCTTKLSGKSPSYYCNSNRGGCGKVLRNMKALDEYMIRRVYEAIKLMPKVTDDKSDDIAEQIEALQKERDETVQAKKDGIITLRDMAEIVNDIDTKIKALRKAQNIREKLPVDDAESFLKADTDKKRATIARIYPVVGVKPTGRKGAKFNPDQLAF